MATTFIGLAATSYISGSNETDRTQALLTIENSGSDSPVIVKILKLVTQLDCTATLTALIPLVRTRRLVGLPTGGTELYKETFDTIYNSAPNVILRSHCTTGSASGGGGGVSVTPILLETGSVCWQQCCTKLATGDGSMTGFDNNNLPLLTADTPFILRPNEAIGIVVNSLVASSNPVSNRYFVQCAWEEETI